MSQAVDSFGKHTPTSAAALAARGIVGALRYHYNLGRAEIDVLHAANIAVGLIAEFDTATWHPPVASPETGPAHGTKAVQVAQALGFPAGAAVWLTIDTAPNGAHQRIRTYFDGAAPIIRAAGYRVGAYGGDRIIDELVDQGRADLAWIAGARSWAEGATSRHACLRQLVAQPSIGGVTVDLNDVLRPDCGWWMPHGTVPTMTTPEANVMLPIYEFPPEQPGAGGAQWLVFFDPTAPNGTRRWHIPNPDALTQLRAAGICSDEVRKVAQGIDANDRIFEAAAL